MSKQRENKKHKKERSKTKKKKKKKKKKNKKKKKRARRGEQTSHYTDDLEGKLLPLLLVRRELDDRKVARAELLANVKHGFDRVLLDGEAPFLARGRRHFI
jgi:hypothetical protein